MAKLQKHNLVAQANSLINARYKITRLEYSLLATMISLINPKDKEFLKFEVTVHELAKMLEIDPKNALREFDKITDRLMGCVIRIRTPHGWIKYQWVSEAEVKNNMVSLKFHHQLKPYLLELKKSGNFTQYRLGQILMFKSFYTSRMYSILIENQSKKIHQFEYSLEHFRKMMLGEKSNSYPLYKNFRNKVLDTAKKELSRQDKATGFYISDLSFDLKTRRTGRKITHLIFTIKTQQTKPTHQQKTIPTQHKNKNVPQIILDYEAIGVMRKIVTPYLNERGEQALINTLNKFKEDKNKGKISKSEQGYLAYLLSANAGQESEAEKNDKNRLKIPTIPNMRDGSQLQAWAIANGLPEAPAGFDTYQYRQMLYNKVEKMRVLQEREANVIVE